jgi:hypothetical protein
MVARKSRECFVTALNIEREKDKRNIPNGLLFRLTGSPVKILAVGIKGVSARFGCNGAAVGYLPPPKPFKQHLTTVLVQDVLLTRPSEGFFVLDVLLTRPPKGFCPRRPLEPPSFPKCREAHFGTLGKPNIVHISKFWPSRVGIALNSGNSDGGQYEWAKLSVPSCQRMKCW